MLSWPGEGRAGSRSVILAWAYFGESRSARVVETVGVLLFCSFSGKRGGINRGEQYNSMDEWRDDG